MKYRYVSHLGLVDIIQLAARWVINADSCKAGNLASLTKICFNKQKTNKKWVKRKL
jgi:hypothetical protein